MDVLYYWKDSAADRKAGRIGYFKSAKDKLDEFQAGYPGFIWVVKTPSGMKGKLQLLARLVWSDTPKGLARKSPGDSHIFYDVEHPRSVWFEEGDAEQAVEEVSTWMRLNFPAAVRGNFQGANGQHALRGPMLSELEAIAAKLATRPFTGAESRDPAHVTKSPPPASAP
ncbi:MAG: hypothetical protein JWP65_810 [Ramlibacter sp.]|jgi:hypothetical protein|uniref:hypothetical protein n=1 Tax=Ramlibacter sp. TaxID=1917967 RepID=UPI00261CB965|nr:hypothetical protein [Ramlibacter sp.]MDB5750389.1 hypothetical protein [Ramlibacter sp.]